MKTFLQIQQHLEAFSMDDSNEYKAGSVKNKICCNLAYEYLYDILKVAEKANRCMQIQKVEVNFVDKVATLPVNFDTEWIVSAVNFRTESDMGDIQNSRYFDFKIFGNQGAKQMRIDYPLTKLYIAYIPVRQDMVNDNDTPVLPDEIAAILGDFALIWYYRMIRDMTGAADALALSQSLLNNKLAALG